MVNESEFDAQAEKAIPAVVNMISGSHDSQTSADVFDVGKFELPDPAGKAGGACTSALLKVFYKNRYESFNSQGHTWVGVLREMRENLLEMNYDQVPQLTSSRLIDVTKPLHIVPPDFNGTMRAVLIGINYVGQNGQLTGCHNDVKNMKEFLMEMLGFPEENMTILMDDGQHQSPTKANILNAYANLVRDSQSGDVVFCHYSGHGSRQPDLDGDEEDGYDETLVPVDFQRAGQILDDDLLKYLVKPLAAGVTMTCLMDCCHSGTVLDLPYRFTADGDVEGMQRVEQTDFGAIFGVAALAGLIGGGADADPDLNDCCCCLEIILSFLDDE